MEETPREDLVHQFIREELGEIMTDLHSGVFGVVWVTEMEVSR
jgi:hypothetical protein